MEGQDAVYISTPRIIINEHYLLQGHHLKHNEARKLVFFFPMYTNEDPSEVMGFRLYTPRRKIQVVQMHYVSSDVLATSNAHR